MSPNPSARLDATASTLIISGLAVTDAAIVGESRRWSTGLRGPVVDPTALVDIDLGSFVRQALAVGVQAIAAAGESQDKLEFQQPTRRERAFSVGSD